MMEISDETIPADAQLLLGPEAVLIPPGFSDLLALAVALWADLEARVEGIHELIVVGDPEERAKFAREFGWDRRTALVVEAAKNRLGVADADRLNALFKIVSDSVDARNEIAHGSWAQWVGHIDCLAIFPNRVIWAAAAAANSDPTSPAHVPNLMATGRIVRLDNLFAVNRELREAGELMHAAWLSYFPADQDMTGRGFGDQVAKITDHPEVIERTTMAARSRRQAQKAAARAARAEAIKQETPPPVPPAADTSPLRSGQAPPSGLPRPRAHRVTIGPPTPAENPAEDSEASGI